MTQKLKSSIIMIKFITKPEYMKFMMHYLSLTYVIVLAAGVQYQTINCKDCLQYKKYLSGYYMAQSTHMTIPDSTKLVPEFVLIKII